MNDSTKPRSRAMAGLTGVIAGLLAWTGVAGDLTVDNLSVQQRATVRQTMRVKEGITYVKPLGGLSMGSYTNGGFDDFAALTNGLVAYWPMEDDDTTNVVVDAVGGHNLTASRNTSALHATGKFGGGFLFVRSSGDQLHTTNWMPSTGQASWTVSFWWKSATVGQQWDTFAAWGLFSQQWGCAIGLFTRSYGVNNFCVQDRHDTYWTSSEESDGQWHHLVATLAGSSKTVTLYVDGVSAVSGVLSYLNVLGPASFKIGDGYGGYSADGLMDDFRVYNRALNSDEVDLLYNYVP